MIISDTYFGKSVDIEANDGRVLYTLKLNDDGSLEIAAESKVIHQEGVVLDTGLLVKPRCSNILIVSREEY